MYSRFKVGCTSISDNFIPANLFAEVSRNNQINTVSHLSFSMVLPMAKPLPKLDEYGINPNHLVMFTYF